MIEHLFKIYDILSRHNDAKQPRIRDSRLYGFGLIGSELWRLMGVLREDMAGAEATKEDTEGRTEWRLKIRWGGGMQREKSKEEGKV